MEFHRRDEVKRIIKKINNMEEYLEDTDRDINSIMNLCIMAPDPSGKQDILLAKAIKANDRLKVETPFNLINNREYLKILQYYE